MDSRFCDILVDVADRVHVSNQLDWNRFSYQYRQIPTPVFLTIGTLLIEGSLVYPDGGVGRANCDCAARSVFTL